jgi:hypothetical protein
MSEQKVNTLRDELHRLREEESKERKDAKLYWKRRIVAVKQQMTDAEKLMIQAGKKQTIRSRIVYQLDELTLHICKPFELRAAEIRYKRSDPEGYEADQIYSASVPVLDHVRSKIQKGKELTKREQEILTKLQDAMSFIAEKKIGHHVEMCQKISEEILSYLTPVSEDEQLSKINKILSQIDAVSTLLPGLGLPQTETP